MTKMKKLDLSIIIDTKEHEIDMQYGLETLKGASDTVSLIAEAILTGEIDKRGRRTHCSKDIRTKLKQSFKSSFGQKFSLEITKPELRSKLKKMGDDVFLEVLSYYVMEALILDSGILSNEASQVLDDLEGVSDNLFKRLDNPLKDMHQISKYYDHNVSLLHKKRGAPEKKLFCLTSKTCENLTDTQIEPRNTIIEAVIVRYHSKTGNGRLHIRGENEFVSFGMLAGVMVSSKDLRQRLSENLHINNLINPEDGTFMNLNTKRKVLPTGEVVKYLVTGIL
jgi:hypothetical protein